MKIPGVAWVGLIGLLVTWLQQYFDAAWVAGAVTALGAIAKLIELYAAEPVIERGEDNGPVPAAMPLPQAEAQPSKVTRWLLGG